MKIKYRLVYGMYDYDRIQTDERGRFVPFDIHSANYNNLATAKEMLSIHKSHSDFAYGEIFKCVRVIDEQMRRPDSSRFPKRKKGKK